MPNISFPEFLIPQVWSETKCLNISKTVEAILIHSGEPLAKNFPQISKCHKERLAPKQKSKMWFLLGKRFSPVQTYMGTQKLAFSSLVASPGWKWSPGWEGPLEPLALSLPIWQITKQSCFPHWECEKSGEMAGAMKSFLYVYPGYFGWREIAWRKLFLFLSTHASENRFSAITDKH